MTIHTPTYDVMALIKFDTTREEFFQCIRDKIAGIADKKMPFEYDKILIVGTVNGEILNEIRFIKFKKNEQTVLQTDNGNG